MLGTVSSFKRYPNDEGLKIKLHQSCSLSDGAQPTFRCISSLIFRRCTERPRSLYFDPHSCRACPTSGSMRVRKSTARDMYDSVPGLARLAEDGRDAGLVCGSCRKHLPKGSSGFAARAVTGTTARRFVSQGCGYNRLLQILEKEIRDGKGSDTRFVEGRTNHCNAEGAIR